MFAFLDPVLIHLHDLLAALDPWVPAALVVVLLTVALRLALHPMNRGMQRGTLRRRDLQPRLEKLRAEHPDDPQALQRATLDLYREEGVSPLPGCLPILIQLPVFSMVYRLFTAQEIDGQHNQLLDHTFLGTPMSDHLFTTGAGNHWVFLVLIALTLVVAAFAARQMRRHLAQDKAAAAAAREAAGVPPAKLSDQQRIMQDSMEQMTKVLPLMSFLTVLAVVSLPLAAGLYLVTSSSWGLLERASLRRIGSSASPG